MVLATDIYICFQFLAKASCELSSSRVKQRMAESRRTYQGIVTIGVNRTPINQTVLTAYFPLDLSQTSPKTCQQINQQRNGMGLQMMHTNEPSMNLQSYFNLHQFTSIHINLHQFTSIYSNSHQFTSIYINLFSCSQPFTHLPRLKHDEIARPQPFTVALELPSSKTHWSCS